MIYSLMVSEMINYTKLEKVICSKKIKIPDSLNFIKLYKNAYINNIRFVSYCIEDKKIWIWF